MPWPRRCRSCAHSATSVTYRLKVSTSSWGLRLSLPLMGEEGPTSDTKRETVTGVWQGASSEYCHARRYPKLSALELLRLMAIGSLSWINERPERIQSEDLLTAHSGTYVAPSRSRQSAYASMCHKETFANNCQPSCKILISVFIQGYLPYLGMFTCPGIGQGRRSDH